jgi:hypothetical protein
MWDASGPDGGDDGCGAGGGVVVCTGEVVGRVAGNGLLTRSSTGVLADKKIVRRTTHPLIYEAAAVDLFQSVEGTGVGKARGGGGLREGIHKGKGATVSERDNAPDDSTSSTVLVRHY